MGMVDYPVDALSGAERPAYGHLQSGLERNKPALFVSFFNRKIQG